MSTVRDGIVGLLLDDWHHLVSGQIDLVPEVPEPPGLPSEVDATRHLASANYDAVTQGAKAVDDHGISHAWTPTADRAAQDDVIAHVEDTDSF